MKKLTLITLAALGLMSMVGCPKKDVASENTIKIGAAGPFTGDMAVFGADQLNAVKLAAAEWNAKGGILGKRIVVVEGDDARDPKQAVAAANKLVNDGVVGVIGHFNSNCSIPASRIYSTAGIPEISHGTTNPRYTEQGFANVFRVSGRDDQQGKVGGEFAVNDLKAKGIAIVHDKTTYGQGLAEQFKKVVGNRATVLSYEGVATGEKDYSPILTKVKSLNPDLVFFGGIYVEAGLLIKQFRALGGTAPFIGGDGMMSPELVKIGGPATEGTYATMGPDAKLLRSAKAFVESYTKKYGEPGVYSFYAYDATNILLSAIAKAGTTEGAKVIAAIKTIEHSGTLGPIRFDAKGDVAVSPFVIWKVEKGAFRQMGR